MHEAMSTGRALAKQTVPERAHVSGVAARLRVALLTNIIPPFRRPLFQEIGRRCKQFRVFLSTAMEPNRDWRVDWEGLDVTIQRTATVTRRIGYNSSGDERQFVHFPIDTFPALTRFRADVVISSELGFRTLGALLYRWRNPKTRLLTWVCVSESTEMQRGKARHLLRKVLLNGIDAFLVNGESGARYLRKMGVPSDKVFRAPYPTDVGRFARADTSRDPRVIHRMMYAGQFVERKGLVPFVRILARWAEDHPQREVELLLIGHGPVEETLRKVQAPPNLRLLFQGFVPYEEMRNAYLSAGIFAFPSLADEWGTVVAEAMACGLPVLGSGESQAVEELVQDGVNGWIFRPGDEAGVYRAIDRCLNTAAGELAEMRRKAKQAAVELSPERIADQVVEAIEYCLEES